MSPFGPLAWILALGARPLNLGFFRPHVGKHPSTLPSTSTEGPLTFPPRLASGPSISTSPLIPTLGPDTSGPSILISPPTPPPIPAPPLTFGPSISMSPFGPLAWILALGARPLNLGFFRPHVGKHPSTLPSTSTEGPLTFPPRLASGPSISTSPSSPTLGPDTSGPSILISPPTPPVSYTHLTLPTKA